MGASAFQQGAVIEINGKECTLLRKVTDTLWQVEESRTKRISERSREELERLYAAGTLTFVSDNAVPLPAKVASPGKPFLDIPNAYSDVT